MLLCQGRPGVVFNLEHHQYMKRDEGDTDLPCSTDEREWSRNDGTKCSKIQFCISEKETAYTTVDEATVTESRQCFSKENGRNDGEND